VNEALSSYHNFPASFPTYVYVSGLLLKLKILVWWILLNVKLMINILYRLYAVSERRTRVEKFAFPSTITSIVVDTTLQAGNDVSAVVVDGGIGKTFAAIEFSTSTTFGSNIFHNLKKNQQLFKASPYCPNSLFKTIAAVLNSFFIFAVLNTMADIDCHFLSLGLVEWLVLNTQP
jgi:Transcription activator MBF2